MIFLNLILLFYQYLNYIITMSNSVDTPYLSDEKEENISEISEEAIGPPLDQNQQILQQVN